MDSLDSELLSIVNAYESHLNRLGLTDHEGIVLLALKSRMFERFAEISGPLIVDGFYDLTDKQLEFFSKLFRCFRRSAVTVTYDKKRPSLFGLTENLISEYTSIGAKVVEIAPLPTSGPDSVLSGFMGEDYSYQSNPDDVEIHFFQSQPSEADWISGTIRSMLINSDCEPGDIMVVSRRNPDAGCPLDVSLKMHGIPLEGQINRPIISHPVIKLLFDALDASINPNEENIKNIQNSWYTRENSLAEKTSSESVDNNAWSCTIAEVDSPDGFITSMKTMMEYLDIKKNFKSREGNSLAIFETIVYDTFIILLDEFREFYSTFRPMMRAEEFSHLLKQFISEITIDTSASPGKGVLFTSANYARYIQRDVVFFTGLDNTSFPQKEDIFSLHNPQTAAEIRDHKTREEEILFYMVMCGAQKLFFTFRASMMRGKIPLFLRFSGK